MKDRALQLAAEAPQGQRRNVLREYVQAHVLYSLQSVRAFERIAFLGGTALRFLYGLHRYSEDLDFSLEHGEGYSFDRLLDRVESDLVKAGFDVTVHPHKGEPVHSAFVRVAGLLYEADLSPHRTEKLSVKIEIDTHPPAGASTKTTQGSCTRSSPGRIRRGEMSTICSGISPAPITQIRISPYCKTLWLRRGGTARG